MKNIKYFILLISLVFVYSCIQKTSFENNHGTCKLKLYSDSMYKFTYPTFFGKKTETGKFQILNSSLTLIRKEINNIDSVNISYTCMEENPENLLITFSDLYRNSIKAKLFINDSKTYYNTDTSGHIIFSYKKLEIENIIRPDERIKSFRIIYNGKDYLIDLSDYKDSRKPDRLDFMLNQFIGEKYAILKREYKFINDTIYLNDIEIKSIGFGNNKLFKMNK